MMWRPILAFLGISLIVGGVLGFQIGGLTKEANQAEYDYIASVTSGKKIVNNPVYILHKAPTYALFKMNIKSIGYYRVVSALFALLAVVSCFFILREWYSDRVAVLGSGLFLTSAWVLHIARLATPEASYLLMMPLLWVAVWLYNTTLQRSALLLLSVLAALSFYIPGFGWLLILAVAWKYKHLWKEVSTTPKWFRFLCVSTMVIFLVPLIWAESRSSQVLLTTFGLPTHFPGLKVVVQNLINIPAHLFFRGPNDPSKWLGRLALLDVFSSVLLLIGLYSLRYHTKTIRTQLLAGMCSVLILLIAVGGPVTITALMPLAYLIIATGLAFMLQQWVAVFPYNPVARALATAIMSIVIILVSYYHINQYFIAWPHTPATKKVFVHTLSDIR